jgi:VPDSG-CTERM motif
MKKSKFVWSVKKAIFVRSLCIAAVVACCPLQTRADTIALSFTGGTPHEVGDFTATVGWAFHLDGPVAVTQLGLWDEGNDGFITDHLMGIFNSTGTALASVAIFSGPGGTLIDGFRYFPILGGPVSLPAGDYSIGAQHVSLFTVTDNFTESAGSITTASGLTYLGSQSALGGFGTFPPGDILGVPGSYFGPNFQFTTPTSAPDTGTTFSLFGLSLTGLAFLRRKFC